METAFGRSYRPGSLTIMRRALLIALVVVAASCSGDSDAPTTTAAATTTAATTPQETAAPTTIAADTSITTTSVATTSATTPAPASTTTLAAGDPAIRIEEIVFAGEPYLIIGNLGSGPGSTEGYWICQFPSYYELPPVDLLPGERLAVPLGTGTVPDLVGVVATADVELPLGTVSGLDGELGLYSSSSFNSPDAIVDYVEWGSSGHARSGVATAAGIWIDGGFVAVPTELLAIVTQAFPTVGPDDWFAEIGG